MLPRARLSNQRSNRTTWLGSEMGRGFRATALNKLNSVVFTPIPRARAMVAVRVKPGLLASPRQASRRSCAICPIHANDRSPRCSSLACSTPPKARRAASRASDADRPRRWNSSCAIARWDWISRAISRSARFPKKRLAVLAKARFTNRMEASPSGPVERPADGFCTPGQVERALQDLGATADFSRHPSEVWAKVYLFVKWSLLFGSSLCESRLYAAYGKTRFFAPKRDEREIRR